MKAVQEWLEGLGLGEYAETFASEQIELADLPRLDSADLKEMGLPIGPRKRVLEAIAALQEESSTASTSNAADASTAKLTQQEAERRQLTVMFCDLVDSTELSQRLDPESLRELMRAYQQTCTTVIEKYDGHVAQYLGDGLMVYFGWPRAHEDDAERAIRTSMEIVDALRQMETEESLHVRIGIATGPVVVGETGAGDASVPSVAVGETPNFAARLQGLAAADEIVVAPATHRLAGGAFGYADMGSHALKGIVKPVQAWRVTGESQAKGRFEATHGEGGLTPLVGRDLELGLLMDRWAHAREGEGQVVLLCGEPGIGKSRILNTLRERLEAEDAKSMRFQCSPYYVNSAFWPSITSFERAMKYVRDEPTDSKLDKLESLIVGHYQRPLSDVRFIATMLSIPCDYRYGEINITPQKFKDETLRTLVDLTEAAARKQHSVLLFEDAHWADPTTLEVLDLLIGRVTDIPLLVVLTHRPEFQNRWADHGHVSALNLSKLTRVQSAAMVLGVAGGKTLPPGLGEQIVGKADGVPLFVEELTKSILESGELTEEGNRFKYASRSRSIAIPATLRDSLMARLDRNASVKDVAQIGSAIGREFSYDLITAVSPLSTTHLDDALIELTDSGLAFRRGTPPDAIYTFKHALVQDAAYGSLLKSRRQMLHKCIAEALEQRFAVRVSEEPEVVAHHYTEAGLYEQAADHWLKAGQRGVARFANAEAVGHATRGLQLLQYLPEGVDRDRLELLLQVNLGTALGAWKGYTPAEVGAAFERARELSERVGDHSAQFLILYGLWTYFVMHADYETSAEFSNEIMALSDQVDEPGAVVLGHCCMAIDFFFSGDLEQALLHGKNGWDAYESAGGRSLGAIYGYDPGVLCSEANAWSLLAMGYPDQADKVYANGIDRALLHAHPLTVATTKAHVAFFDALREDPTTALATAVDAVGFCKDNSILLRQAEAQIVEGWAIAEAGEPDDGVDVIEAGLDLWQQLGAHIFDS
jgi:class 3 adenylate cyclase